jgi:Holliday junction resolvase
LTPEAKVKAKVHALLKKYEAYAVNYIGGAYANSGTPDILACVRGKFFGIEVKAGKNKPTELQLSNLRRIEAAGGVSLVINETNLDVLETALNENHNP